MIRFTQGWVASSDNSRKAPVVVKADELVGLKDLLIGIVSITFGLAWLILSAFRNGSQAHEQAEYDALVKVGCIKEDKDDVKED